MGWRRRFLTLPPMLRLLLQALLCSESPRVQASSFVSAQESPAPRDGYSGHLTLQSAEVYKFRRDDAVGLRRLLGLHLEDEDEDDADEGSGTPSMAFANIAPQTPSSAHHLRHDKGRSGDQRSDLLPAENVVSTLTPTRQPAGGMSRPQPASPPLAPLTTSHSPPPPPPPPPALPPRRRLRAHDGCYSSNEVLLVVGVTCAVNFAFILIVVALVHLCNRGAAKVVPAALEYEAPVEGEHRSQRRGCGVFAAGPAGGSVLATAAGAVDVTGSGGAGGATGVYARVQEYVDSLPDEMSQFRDDVDGGEEAADEDVEARRDDGGGNGGGARVGTGPIRTGARASRRRSAHGLHTAFSMEQLLFVD